MYGGLALLTYASCQVDYTCWLAGWLAAADRQTGRQGKGWGLRGGEALVEELWQVRTSPTPHPPTKLVSHTHTHTHSLGEAMFSPLYIYASLPHVYKLPSIEESNMARLPLRKEKQPSPQRKKKQSQGGENIITMWQWMFAAKSVLAALVSDIQ